MKKLIGIVVLGLLLCVNSYADEIILECKDEYYDTTKILDLLIFKKEGNIWTLKSSVNNDFFTEGVQTENGQDVLIDISKSDKNRNMFYKVVENFAKNCFVPICVGGKIKTISEVRKFQELGADKILINSSFIKTC